MSQGDELADCFWDSEDVMVHSREEGSKVVRDKGGHPGESTKMESTGPCDCLDWGGVTERV